MHLADPIFIFILALVLLGPKRTGELAHKLGKLMAEFRKASNDFKFQFNEEMRQAEQQEKQRKQAEAAALPAAAGESAPAENSILTPAAAEHQPGAVPYAVSATTGAEQPVDDHPLLRVDHIPPMDGHAPSEAAADEEHERAHG